MTTMVEDARVITGGVDTHADMHVAAALDSIGGLLGVREFPATAAGYASLLSWLRSFGILAAAGVEGTGSYGAGLARHLAAAGVRVVEVDRPDRQDRARQGKSDPLDAVSAARAALSGRASGAPRGQLLDAADGIPSDTAAAGLIISHEHFLHRDAFRRAITTGTSISTGQPLAAISWDAALHALNTGQMPCASSEQAILQIAASLGDPAIAVRLRTVLGNLDARNIILVTSAITTANG